MKVKLTGILLLAIMALSAVFAQGCMSACEYIDMEAWNKLMDDALSLTQENDQLQQQLEKQKSELAALQAQKGDIETETLATNADIATSEQEANDLQQQSDSVQAELDSIDQQIADKEAEIAEAEKKLQEITDELEVVDARLRAIFSVSSGWCFAGDTLVLMADGSLKQIKDIQPGETVLSYDTASGSMVAADVIDTASGQAGYYYLVNGNLKVVPPHPFLTADGQWVAVEDLQVGDIVMSNSGTTEINSIEMVDSGLDIFNIYVEDCQNFYVSADGQEFYLVREQ